MVILEQSGQHVADMDVHSFCNILILKKYKQNPKYLIGYSDVTVLQSYLLKNGFASIHGQSIKTSSQGVSEASYEDIFNILNGKKLKYEAEDIPFNKKREGKRTVSWWKSGNDLQRYGIQIFF